VGPTGAARKQKGRQWQLQDAKNRLSEVVETALTQGPQTITRRGKPVVVVVPFEEYCCMTKPRTSLVEFLRRSALRGVKLPIERSSDTGREIEL
jgi:prevent-host-death family protein